MGKINLISIGKNANKWLSDGFAEYAKRLPNDYKLQLIEIPTPKRSSHANLNQIKEKEGNDILTSIPKGSLIVALDEHGQQWDTVTLAAQLKQWRENWPQISILIGGPDGLAPSCLDKAHIKWSLAALTFPHLLVRIIVAEQLYRAWSIITNHPYHRV